MGQPFPTQHPAVVLRSQFKLVSWLLAIAMAAVLALSATVVIVANDDDGISASSSAETALPNAAAHAHPLASDQAPGVRYDGGPEEGTRSIIVVPQGPAARYDGGPNEGTRAIAQPAPGPAPERVTDGGSTSENTPRAIPMGPGGR